MDIIQFYEEVSRMLEKARSGRLSTEDAKSRLLLMIKEAKESNIDVNMDPNIFEYRNLIEFDDERSYEEDYSSSYEQ